MNLLPTNYKRGRSAEYKVKRRLEALGYRWIIRSAASHTPVDLLCSNGSEILAVQVKAGLSPYISQREKRSLIKWAECFNAKPILARRRGGRWVLEEVPR